MKTTNACEIGCQTDILVTNNRDLMSIDLVSI